MTKVDEFYMQRCLQLAKKGINDVKSNPMVGCVITIPQKDSPLAHEIIAEGYHKSFGKPHAEVEAINKIKDKKILKNATLYVNLEPCAHFGKTPPCADLVLSMQFHRVVVGMKDPNPLVSGRGIQNLENAGIHVDVNVLQTECESLNRKFRINQLKNRPYILLKWAECQNGYLSVPKNEEKQISNPRTKQIVHKFRSQFMSICVAKNTVNEDDPSLTNRLWAGDSPLRILLDSNLSSETNRKIWQDEKELWVFGRSKGRRDQKGVKKIIEKDPKDLESVLGHLYENGVTSLLVEGGAALLDSFIEKDLWDEAVVLQGARKINQGKKVKKSLKGYSNSQNIGKNKLSQFINS